MTLYQSIAAIGERLKQQTQNDPIVSKQEVSNVDNTSENK